MSDKLHRFTLENLHLRGEWVSLKSTWKEIQKTADYPEPLRHVLGEALAAISLLAESLKFDGSLILQIRGTQPVTMLVVQASSEGTVRAIAHWNGALPDNATFNELFGAGTMVISVENNPKPGQNKGERYQSLVSLEGETLADCLKEYFAQSEQLSTRLWLAADDDCVTGLMLQSLPSDDSSDIKDDQEAWTHAIVLAETLKNEELLTLDAQELLHRLYHEEDLRLYDAQPISFKCTCSQEKINNAVYSLGEVEANELLKEQGEISVDCEFCNTKYTLDGVDVKKIFAENEASILPSATSPDDNGSSTIH
ncbi:MAG: Hsp33 family molecular chaperone HslO [Cocleimonas sp.]